MLEWRSSYEHKQHPTEDYPQVTTSASKKRHYQLWLAYQADERIIEMSGIEGTRLGNYHILRRVGGGGMGDVYLAEQPDLGRQVAIKILRGQTNPTTSREEQRQAMQQFMREARAIAALEHPNIIPLYDFNEQNGILYLVMQYVPFGSLADFLNSAPMQRYRLPLPLSLVADLINQAASALQFAHDHNVVHLDVKPQNLLLRVLPLSNTPVHPQPGQHIPAPFPTSPNEEVPVRFHLLLADFGLARFMTWISTHSGVTGTPLYTAPEQYQGQSSPATDQYALAEVAYLLLTGEPVFKGTVAELYHQHLSVLPRQATLLNPQLPAAVNPVLARALAKNPLQRFPRILDFAQALQAAINPTGQWQGYTLPASVIWPSGTPSAPPANIQQGTPPRQAPLAPASPWAASIPPIPTTPPGSNQTHQPYPPGANQPNPPSTPSAPAGWQPAHEPDRWADAPTVIGSFTAPEQAAAGSMPSPQPMMGGFPNPATSQPMTGGFPDSGASQPPVGYTTSFQTLTPGVPGALSSPYPDAPRAPLPPRAKSSRFLPKRIFNRLALWQRVALLTLVVLIIAGSVTAFLLIRPSTGSPQNTPAAQVATENMVRYGSLNAANLPTLQGTPTAQINIVVRTRIPSTPTNPGLFTGLPTISTDMAATDATSSYPSDAPVPLQGGTLNGLSQKQIDLYTPIDVSIASNGADAIEVVDGALLVTGSNRKAIDLNSFFQQIPGNYLVEPRILFDPGLEAWILVANQLRLTGSNGSVAIGFIDIAISESPSPLGTWDIYQFGTQVNRYSACNYGDNPQIGINASAIFITATNFDCGVNGNLRGATLWELPKANLSTGANTSIYVATGFTTGQGKPVVTLTPAVESSQDQVEWLLSNESGYAENGRTSNQVMVWAVFASNPQNSGSSPIIIRTPVALANHYADPPATQYPTITTPLATGDARITQVHFAKGQLFGAFTTAINWDKATVTRSGIYWFALTPTLNNASDPNRSSISVSITQQSIFGAPDRSFFYPAFVADAFGNAVLLSEEAGPQVQPHIVFSSRLSQGPANLLGGEKNQFITLASTGPFNIPLWGDYNGGAAAPIATNRSSSSILVASPTADPNNPNAWKTTIWQIPTSAGGA
jgi:serine/threonine-protein kinase